ncbi:MAG: restriction endonuclease subunit S, partial [Saprospiraceae bacterium]
IDGIVSLPLNTFFTTNKKTYILCITKKANKKDVQNDPVFTYLVSEMGESRDVYRFDIDQDDLSEAVKLFKGFRGSKEYFIENNSEKRCKIIPFSTFVNSIDSSWIIDNWWSEEEKIELGISEKKDKLGLLEFSSLVEDVAVTIKGFQEEIKELSEKKKSKINYKTLKVKDLFTIERGKGLYIKRYIDVNKGDFPVYSGNTFGAFSFINSFDYDVPCISWAIDGLAGYVMIHNEKFSATNHRGVLIPKNPLINLHYAKFVLEPLFRTSKKGRIGADGSNEYTALPPFMLEDIEFEIPVDENNNIDIDFQNLIVDKIIFIEDIKRQIEEYKSQIKNLLIEIENTFVLKKFTIDELFDIKSGNSNLTKKFLNANKGEYVVYSANTKENGVFGFIKTFDYDIECIQITTNGVYASTVYYREKHKFSINSDARLLIKRSDDLDYTYLTFELINVFADYGFNWENKPTIGKETVQ